MFTTPLPTLMLGPETGFAGGTRIHTQEGLKPIESIRVGDRVLTHPDQSPPPNRRRAAAEYQYQRVTRATSIEVPSLLRITLQNMADGIEDTLLVATGQPIWTKPSGWLAAQDVRTGHAVVLSFNGNALVQQVQPSNQPARVHWLEVEGCNSYYVEQLGTWVGCRPEVVAQAASGGYKKIDFDGSQPQVLLEIKDYYNDTLAPPVAPDAPGSELAEKMRAAAEKLRRAFKEQLQKDLGYDEDSVRWLDGYIERARLRPSNDQWKSAIHSMGAFLGECTIRSLGGHWSRHEHGSGVALHEGLVFPLTKVAKQFANGAESGDSILGFYQVCKSLSSNGGQRKAETATLTLGQLERGNQLVEISYGASDKHDGDRHAYSTTLRNISRHKIRITKFGGYRAVEHAWQLANVNGEFYTTSQFREWYGQKAEWLQPGETASDGANWGDQPVLWAYHGVTDTGESFIAGKLLETPVAAPGGHSGRHFVNPVPPQPEMAQIIHKLRASYEARQQRMNSMTLASLKGPTPSWLQATDGLAEFFDHQDLLLTEGHVVWGALVQANSLLFQPGDVNCPGLLVHSPDDHFDARPQELQLIGRTFFSFKHTDPTDPELKEVARLVTDEVDRSMGFELPRVFSSKPVRSATFMVFRKHIPNGVLSASLFPILTHPSTRAVMVVPFEFWPIELIVLWKENRI